MENELMFMENGLNGCMGIGNELNLCHGKYVFVKWEIYLCIGNIS